MKRILLFLILLSAPMHAQRHFLCIGGVKFETSLNTRMFGEDITLLARFDVRDFKAVNISLSCSQIDSAKMSWFARTAEENVKKIIFLHDTVGARLTVHYSIASPRTLNNDFASSPNDSTLDLTFRGNENITRWEGDYSPIAQTTDTVRWYGYIQAEPASSTPSDILVERRFFAHSDSSIIIRCNHPELRQQIIDSASRFEFAFFQSLTHDRGRAMPSDSIRTPEALRKTYIVRFYILRRIQPCGYEETL